DRGDHDVRVYLVLAPGVGAAKPGRVASAPLLLAAAVGAGGYQRRRRVPVAGHRIVRPVHAAAEGRTHGRSRAGLPDVALPTLGVYHAGVVQEGTPFRGGVRGPGGDVVRDRKSTR